ncbi:acyltransferase family protein [Pedobacter duraquae]|uniref:Fucose 4-O-acetylase-like acetyltransferase n=1 Tax=Pedobacter duraquae TaxID=425511 RepID=A0A4R6IHI7_9SPHI|nr:acyltransferase [Pedobacter duraquae]TDO21418.1 fucose 4-O-acetylase-like acetyltransferase [Pedobacter duraquae]
MTELKKQKNYDFIDSIRFISMIGIVMEHSTLFWGKHYTILHDQIIQTVSLQVFKFGTIIFFLLSGFLIGDKFATYNSKEYMKRRFDNTFKPWLFWCFMMLFLTYLDMYVRYAKFGDPDLITNPVPVFFENIVHITMFTAYWFILNFMICIGTLLLFRKYIHSNIFGAILGLLSLLYSLNLYVHWFPTAHTIAFLGFIFYLWLGFKINVHYDKFVAFINRIRLLPILLLVVLTFTAACWESVHLMDSIPDDPFNTLRLSNIIYSLVAFVFLFKYANLPFISRLKPRQTTFGIYLIHQLLVFYLLPLIFKPLGISNEQDSIWFLVALQFIRFFIVYAGAYVLALAISKLPKGARWVIGQ